MSDAAFELKDFEHVEAIPGRALLRIAAAPTFEPAASTLIVDGTERIRPLPAPPGPPGVTRVAFSLPAELAAAARSYALELDGGELVDLPVPGHRESSPVALAGAGLSGPAPAPAEPVDDGAADVIAELERRLGAERAQRVSADTAAQTSAAARAASETRLKSLGAELADARSDLAATTADLQTARDDLRAAQGEAELGQTRANHARAEAEAAESALVQRAAEIQLLRQTLTDRDNHAQVTYLQWEQISAGLTAEVEAARQVAANFQQHARTLQLELADSQLELTSLRALREAATEDSAAADAGDPAVMSAQLNAAAAALEQARARASEAENALMQRETELDRLRGQLPAAQ
jgi:hypothetical protein